MTARAKLDPLLGQHFATAAAREAGVSAGRLRARDLERPFWGARSIRSRDSAPCEPDELLRQRCRAFVTVAPPQFRFSHVTAARLYGLPLPSRLLNEAGLHVSVPIGASAPRRHGLIGHRIAILGEGLIDGLPVMPAEVAWLQLAPLLSLDELVVAGDALVRRKRPLATLSSMRAAADVVGGRRGITRARQALADIRVGTDSPQESRLRLVFTRAGLPEPIVHLTVHHEGAFVGTPDLAYPAHRIAIEYQGKHHRDHDVFEDDIVRRELFRRADWHVMLVTSRTLARPQSLAAELSALLAERCPG